MEHDLRNTIISEGTKLIEGTMLLRPLLTTKR